MNSLMGGYFTGFDAYEELLIKKNVYSCKANYYYSCIYEIVCYIMWALNFYLQNLVMSGSEHWQMSCLIDN